MAKVTVIVLSYNSKQYVLKCIRSILASEYKDYEVLLVDNASSDGTPEEVTSQFPMIRVIRSRINLGRTGGYNLGAKFAEGSLILYLDQDTEISPTMLGELVEVLESSGSIGACGGKIYYYDYPSTLWSVGTYVSMLTGKTHFIGYGKVDDGRYDTILNVQQHPTALMVKKQLVDAIGGYDPDLFMVYCDADFCVRLWKTGHRIVLAPKAKLWHKVKPPSTVVEHLGMKTPVMAFLIGRNRIIFMRKNAPKANFMLFLTIFLPAYLLWYLLACLGTGEMRMMQGFWKGTVCGLIFACFGEKSLADVFDLIRSFEHKISNLQRKTR
jgi:hypothetical protein